MSSPLGRLARLNGGPRPRVLLVDDQGPVLEAVSAILADDFDVVGTAADGHQALDMARRVHPDVIVLDIEMPGLDGFQTIRALAHAGLPDIPVVFLSMHQADEIVGLAFACGGRGYVQKSRATRDLPTALEQALVGRSFVPSLTSLSTLTNGGGHAMQLHRDGESLLDGLAACVDLALRRGDATCVIATTRVREGLGHRLRMRGWDVGSSSGHQRYLAIDAADALDRFMRNGLPDRGQLAGIAAELDQYRAAVAERATSRLTVFGNMVELLCAEGNVEAVIALERLWNTLTRELPFVTLCAYGTSCFHDGVPELWPAVCAEHLALSHAGDV